MISRVDLVAKKSSTYLDNIMGENQQCPKDISATTAAHNQFEMVLQTLINPHNNSKYCCSNERIQQQSSLRLAAVTSALMETVLDVHRSTKTNDNRTVVRNGREEEEKDRYSDVVTPGEIFASALTVLEGTLFQKTHDTSATETSPSPQVPLLQLLEIVIPFVVSVDIKSLDVKVFVKHINLLCRVLRGVGITMIGNAVDAGKTTSRDSKKGGYCCGTSAGNASLRQVLATCRTAIMGIITIDAAASTSNTMGVEIYMTIAESNDKHILRLCTDVLLGVLNHSTPKVRKAAHGCLGEILKHASVTTTSSLSSRKRGSHVAEILIGHVTQYICAILSSFSCKEHGRGYDGDEDVAAVHILHLLQFVRQFGSPLCLAESSMISTTKKENSALIDESMGNMGTAKSIENSNSIPYELLRLIQNLLSSVPPSGQQKIHHSNCTEHAGLLIVNSAMKSLTAAMEYTIDDIDNVDNGSLINSSRINSTVLAKQQEIGSRLLASLLQQTLPILTLSLSFTTFGRNNGRNSGGKKNDSAALETSCHATFTHLIVTIECKLLERKCDEIEDSEFKPQQVQQQQQNNPMQLIGLKLLPLSISTIINTCGSACDYAQSCSIVRSCTWDLRRLVNMGFSTITWKTKHDVDEEVQSQHSIITAIVDIVKKLLQIRFRTCWEQTLPVYAIVVISLALSGSSSDAKKHLNNSKVNNLTDIAGEMLQSLVHLQSDVSQMNDNRATITSVHDAIGGIISELGCEVFLSLAMASNMLMKVNAIEDKAQKGNSATRNGLRADMSWLLDLLESRGRSVGHNSQMAELDQAGDIGDEKRMHLSFFHSKVLGMARLCDAATSGGNNSTPAEISIQKQACLDLWSLLPFFCQNPVDIADAFPVLAPTLARAMQDKRYPQLVVTISTALKTLAEGAARRAEGASSELDHAGGESIENGPLQDFRVISEVSVKLLPALFKRIEHLAAPVSNGGDVTPSENVQAVQSVTVAIGELARLCPKPFLQSLFKKVMHKLVSATQQHQQGEGTNEDDNEHESQICTLLRLAHALVTSASLDRDSINLLYRVTKPFIRSDEMAPKIQKQAYKVMAEICQRHCDFVSSADHRVETIELLVGSIMTCHVSSRHMRLKCLVHLVDGLDSSNEDHMGLIPKIAGEVLLCLKDANGKTREGAYELLSAMAKKGASIADFFRIILAALGGQTSHMRSAAVMALSRLVWEFSRTSEEVQKLLPSVLRTVIVLFDENTREVNKSVVGFIRVCVAAMSIDKLEPLLPDVVGGLMKSKKGKDRFRLKIKIILKKLVRMYGYDTITSLVPANDQRLVTHMRKVAERAARKKVGDREQNAAPERNGFEELIESDEEDSDDGRTLMTEVTSFSRKSAMSGRSDRSGTNGPSVRAASSKSMATSHLTAKRDRNRQEGAANGPRLKIERDGEVLDMLGADMAKNVHFYNEEEDSDSSEDDAVLEFDSSGRLVVHDDLNVSENSVAADAKVDEKDEMEKETGNIKFGAKRKRPSKFDEVKRFKAEASSRKERGKKPEPKSLGASFQSKRAGGDVKKKGQKFEPYAFVPLDGRSFTKKNREKAVSQMATVVRGRKKRRRKG